MSARRGTILMAVVLLAGLSGPAADSAPSPELFHGRWSGKELDTFKYSASKDWIQGKTTVDIEADQTFSDNVSAWPAGGFYTGTWTQKKKAAIFEFDEAGIASMELDLNNNVRVVTDNQVQNPQCHVLKYKAKGKVKEKKDGKVMKYKFKVIYAEGQDLYAVPIGKWKRKGTLGYEGAIPQ